MTSLPVIDVGCNVNRPLRKGLLKNNANETKHKHRPAGADGWAAPFFYVDDPITSLTATGFSSEMCPLSTTDELQLL